MKSYLLLPVLLLLLLPACETQTQTTAATTATGALIGAAIADEDNRLTGAALGGAAGFAAAQLIGPATTQGNCYYRTSSGDRIIAPCGQ
jgi:hypothetical protein